MSKESQGHEGGHSASITASASNSPRELPPAARRALAEAAERRKAADEKPGPAREIGGRGGKDPARYGDWEIKGRAIDF